MNCNEKKHIIFHIDVNSAFLSWTNKLLKSKNPYMQDIRDKVCVISGNREKRQGVVLAKSILAKDYGIKSGEPVYLALKKYPKLLIFPPNYEYYSKCSKEFVSFLSNYSNIIEQYSIDECFLDVTNFLNGKDPILYARKIQNEIIQNLGFSVNIGIGNSKLLAKTASDLIKPNKIVSLLDEQKNRILNLPIEKLFFIGKKTSEILLKLGIKTIKQFINLGDELIYKKLGKNGIKIYNILIGKTQDLVTDIKRETKSISHDETFEEDIDTLENLNSKLMDIVEKISKTLRQKKLKCKTICVNIRTKYFEDIRKQKSIKYPCDSTLEIYNYAKELLEKLFPSIPIRLLGVTLSNLTKDEDFEQISFFDNFYNDSSCKIPDEKHHKLDIAIDQINEQNEKVTRAINLININKNKNKNKK